MYNPGTVKNVENTENDHEINPLISIIHFFQSVHLCKYIANTLLGAKYVVICVQKNPPSPHVTQYMGYHMGPNGFTAQGCMNEVGTS